MLIAFIPAAVIGLVFKKKIDKYLFNTLTVAVAMIVGGTLLIIIENSFRKSRHSTRDLESVSPIQALKIGVFQCLSLWPGMSRSASTIMGGWVSGLSTPAAAEFSFFLAIPTMIAASGLDIIKDRPHMNSIELIALILGFIVSFLVALLVVEKFINFLKKKPMRVFAIYRILIGIVLLVLAALKVITITK
jgi:undecaprenyl-diphosphatase